MKKTLIAAAAAVALTASAAAEITFGAWVRTLPVLAASDGDKTVTGLTNSWGWGGARPARVDINAVAEDGNAGFTMGVYNDCLGGGLGDSGSARMWVKPVEQVKLTVGSMSADNNVGGYRGDFCYGSWDWLRPFNWITDGEGFTFDGISKTGALVEVFPVDGLAVYAHVPLGKIGKTEAEETYKNIQAGFAYTIDGVGKLKAQYIGNYTAAVEAKAATPFEIDPDTGKIEGNKAVTAKDAVNNPKLEVAFELTSVENLYATAGFAYETDSKDMRVALGASYQINEDAKVSASFELKKTDSTDATDMAFGAGVDYNLADGISVNADVRGLMLSKETTGADDETYMSFLVGVKKGISSNGLIGVGFQGTTNGFGFLNPNDSDRLKAAEADSFCWAIPVRVEMWF